MIKKVAASAVIILVALAVVWHWGLAKDSAPIPKYSLQAAQTPNEAVEESTSVTPGATADTVNSGTPVIFFPETSHDFGSIAQGSKVSYTFVVRNTGDAPLKLIKAKAG